MILNRNTILPAAPAAKPVQYALKALRRDFDRVFTDTAAPGGRILLTINDTLPAEQYTLTVDADTLPVRGYVDSGVTYVPMPSALSTVCLKSAAAFWACSRSGSGTTSRLLCGRVRKSPSERWWSPSPTK